MKNINFNYVEVKNFKVFKDIKFDFANNSLTVISGENGSGKSSIIDSVFYALFDKTPKGISGDDVVRKRSNGDCSVILNFNINDDIYEIKSYRKHKKFHNKKFLVKNGKDISGTSKKETNELISDLVIPEDIFTNCLLFNRYSGKNFIDLTQAKQREIIDELLGLNKYDQYYENVSEYRNELINRINDNKEIDELEIHIENCNHQLNKCNEEILSLEDRKKSAYNKYKEKRDNIEQHLKDLSEFENEFETVNNYLIKLNEKKTILDNKVKDQRELCRLERSNKEQELKLSYNDEKENCTTTLYEERSKYIDVINGLQSKLNNESQIKNERLNKLEDTRQSNYNIINESFKELADYKNANIYKEENNLSRLQNSIEDKKKQKSELEHELVNIDKKNNNKDIKICHVCNQEIKDENALKYFNDYKNTLQSKINNISNDITNAQGSIKEIKTKLLEYNNEYKNRSHKIESDKVKLDSYVIEKTKEIEFDFERVSNKINESICENKKKVSDVENKIKNIKDELNEKYKSIIDKELDKINKQHREKISNILDKQLPELENEIQKYETKINNVKEKIKDLNNYKEELNELNTKYKEFIHYCEEENKKLENEIRDYKNKISEYSEKIKEVKKFKKQLDDELTMVEFWKEAFSNKGLKSYIIDNAIPFLNNKSLELSKMTDVLRVSFDSQVELKSGESRNRFNINVSHIENLSTFNELSSGETTLVNIIVLLSLRYLLESMYNVKLNVLLFDEMLDSLDENNIIIAVNMLKNLSVNHSIILITHSYKDFIEADEHFSL